MIAGTIESHEDIMVVGYETTMYRLANGNVGAHYGAAWLERDTETNLRALLSYCVAMDDRMPPREITVHAIEEDE